MGLGGIDNTMCRRVLDLLVVSYLRLGEVVVMIITVVGFRMNDWVSGVQAILESR